jgi:hypothetical protein
MEKVGILGMAIERQSEARHSQFFKHNTSTKMPLIQSSQDYLPCKKGY